MSLGCVSLEQGEDGSVIKVIGSSEKSGISQQTNIIKKPILESLNPAKQRTRNGLHNPPALEVESAERKKQGKIQGER